MLLSKLDGSILLCREGNCADDGVIKRFFGETSFIVFVRAVKNEAKVIFTGPDIVFPLDGSLSINALTPDISAGNGNAPTAAGDAVFGDNAIQFQHHIEIIAVELSRITGIAPVKYAAKIFLFIVDRRILQRPAIRKAQLQ